MQHLKEFQRGMERRDEPFAGSIGIDVDITFLLPGKTITEFSFFLSECRQENF